MLIAMTGATGYVGSEIARKLLRRDHEIRALVRSPARAGFLQDLGIQLVTGDLSDRDALRLLVEGAGAVVHLAAIIVEQGRQTFEAIHVTGTQALLGAAREAGTSLLLYMSALGARDDSGATEYHRTKWAAEEAVRAGGIPYAIFRPSIVAGLGSVPLGKMVSMIRLLPVVPVIGDGRYEMQPVWIGDVAEAFARALEREDLRGSFDLGGPERLTYHQVLDRLETALGVSRPRVGVPVGMVRLAAAAGAALPNLAPITSAQLQMLLEGSTTAHNALDSRFGVEPLSFSDVAREICAPYAARGAAEP
jgi:uncharacterized protein YbjT (DUF2867 family)